MIAGLQTLLRQQELLKNNIQLNSNRRSTLIATDMALAAEMEQWGKQLDQVEEAIQCLKKSQS